MSRKQNKIIRRRLAGSYLSSVISISLVLLLIGAASFVVFNASSVSSYFREHIHVNLRRIDLKAVGFPIAVDSDRPSSFLILIPAFSVQSPGRLHSIAAQGIPADIRICVRHLLIPPVSDLYILLYPGSPLRRHTPLLFPLSKYPCG